ncbi:MAG: glycosyltransferase 87 family protein [Vicinamibacteria bacterium]
MSPLQRRLAGVSALLLIAIQIPLVWRTGGDASQSDFANYFAPAFALAHGNDLGALYQRDGFERALSDAGLDGLGSFVPHPPANALWLLPFARLDPSTAKTGWTVVLLLGLGLTVWAAALLSPRTSLAQATAVVLLPVLAIRNGLAFGQPYLLLSAWIALGVVALQRHRLWLGGFLLGLGVSFKPYALVLGLLFVHRSRRRALVGFACGAVLPSLLVLTLAGTGPFVEFVSKVLPWMMRAEIQDPFSSGWGSASALLNRLFRFEPDLNAAPWLNAPILARLLGAGVPAGLLSVGVVCGRRAFAEDGPLQAVGVAMLFAMASSPFVASYQLVLMTVPVLALLARVPLARASLWLVVWFVVGSPLINAGRAATGLLAPAAYARFFVILGMAIVVAWPWLDRRAIGMAGLVGIVSGVAALPVGVYQEVWPRIDRARGYSMMRPSFCGDRLRWMSPSADGRRLEVRGATDRCDSPSVPSSQRVTIASRFAEGSFNLYLRPDPSLPEGRLTYSDANEVDPVLTPDGCAVVFASDQGRGLGSYALYRLDVSGWISECGKGRPAVSLP